ncbi:MAG: hypothetical protein LBD17_02690 [Endomicrobium sp.]|jgi:hypothetical protein|nr:hypothetical protein [Endomicrobium sp.]
MSEKDEKYKGIIVKTIYKKKNLLNGKILKIQSFEDRDGIGFCGIIVIHDDDAVNTFFLTQDIVKNVINALEKTRKMVTK